MSDREQLGLRERARTAPAPRREPSREPWRALEALGNMLTRTTTALADLARLHDSPVSMDAQQVHDAQDVINKLAPVQQELWQLTSRYSDLQQKYTAAKEQTVRDIA
jgi:hypothetical protein